MAINYTTKLIKVGSLRLDPKNTRIPVGNRSEDQRQILHWLLENENVSDLAKKIARRGLFPQELLIAVQEGKKYIVLEGNRRLAAIRLLMAPELASTPQQVTNYKKLSSQTDLTRLGKLDVVVVNTRLDAAPIISAVHTHIPKKRWDSLQQAQYFRELSEEGLSPEEVADKTDETLGHVRSLLRSEKLYQLALTLEYPEAIRNKIQNPRFPLTTLERFIESTHGRKLLGIELDDILGFAGKVHTDRFKAVLAQIMNDIVTEDSFTRQINKSSDWEKYIAKVEAKLPKTKKRGKFIPDDILPGGNSSPGPKKQPPKPPAKRAPRKSRSVVPYGFNCTCKNQKVRAVFNELKSIKIESHPNSTGVMLRVLLDIALWTFITEYKHDTKACDFADKNGKQRRNNPQWTPPIKKLISYSVKNRIFSGMSADGYKALGSLAAGDADYFITIEGFNAFTHNPFVTPTESDIRKLWERAEPMLEIILR
ncbi:hypothetical protein [Dethiosulfatarculus sandiegensis]|uniref:ParB/Sulfiredoxin domain-containing protein n=1 Tax=Dethiosulfatarculus sandiegensis TaxID=1429043 RepID=A0A0D2JBZ7_9BACT|nr:hypothetical protein [Dethiosulfatarculus sandiegensis]KIX15669.1 hypothetical protein X474_01870 [Dethiosulfatarculus sandiegensis]